MDAAPAQMQSPPVRRHAFARSGQGVSTVLFLVLAAGCATHRGQSLSDLPARHSVRAERLVIHSDSPINEKSAIITELAELRLDILSTLNLPESRRPVVVYLFRDHDRYTAFMRQRFPQLPTRRAFFVGTPSELAVYAYHGENLATDLRHEYTHGVLHSSLKHLPLWLDEGLAEYFETPRDRHHVNDEHVTRLAAAVQGGWQPDLKRLEQLAEVSEMQAMDYHEAWAWVYSMMTSGTEDAARLVDYVHACNNSTNPAPLSEVLAASLPGSRMRLLEQVSFLSTGGEASEGVIPAAFERPARTSLD